MIVNVVEVGKRPSIWTKARRFAPAGARVLGEIFGEAEFADEALIILDWDNTMNALPNELSIPVVHIMMRKTLRDLPPPNVLDLTERLDVDETFGDDSITGEMIHDIVYLFKDKMEEQIARRLA